MLTMKHIWWIVDVVLLPPSIWHPLNVWHHCSHWGGEGGWWVGNINASADMKYRRGFLARHVEW